MRVRRLSVAVVGAFALGGLLTGGTGLPTGRPDIAALVQTEQDALAAVGCLPDGITWSLVPAGDLPDGVVGESMPSPPQIKIMSSAQAWDAGRFGLTTMVRSTVRHEVAHQLLYRAGYPPAFDQAERMADMLTIALSDREHEDWVVYYLDDGLSPAQAAWAQKILAEQCQAGTV